MFWFFVSGRLCNVFNKMEIILLIRKAETDNIGNLWCRVIELRGINSVRYYLKLAHLEKLKTSVSAFIDCDLSGGWKSIPVPLSEHVSLRKGYAVIFYSFRDFKLAAHILQKSVTLYIKIVSANLSP